MGHVDNLTVKSEIKNGFKYALMNPSVENRGKIVHLTFRVKNNPNNWLAVGLCHKKTVEAKKYVFGNGSGHGGYLITSNGLSWHTSDQMMNNRNFSFPFGVGDEVTCIVNFETSSVLYVLGNRTFEHEFKVLPDNPLHPCVVTSAKDDEV